MPLLAAKIPGARNVEPRRACHAPNSEAAEAFNCAVREFLEEI
jgi:pimeloyl-ACP methyl ester carboxylesterase